MMQLSRESAIELANSGVWKSWTDHQRAAFQMVQDKLCMPFDVFHESVTKALGRPVYTHEFGLNRQGLIEELAGRAGHPSIDEIMALLPQDKLLAIDLAAPGGT